MIHWILPSQRKRVKIDNKQVQTDTYFFLFVDLDL